MSGRPATLSVMPGIAALSVGLPDLPPPPGWAWFRLDLLARLESGHTPSREHPEYWDGNIAWIGIRDARENDGKIIDKTLQSITPLGIENSAARVLPAGTVCLSRTASIGYTVIMGRPMATSQDFVNWVCSEQLEPLFLQRLFKAELASLHKFSKGSTHSTIYFPEVKAFHICAPPVPEQRRIVAKADLLLTRLGNAKQAIERIPGLLDRLRHSILTAALRGRLTADWRARNPDGEHVSSLLERVQNSRNGRNLRRASRAEAAVLNSDQSGDQSIPSCWKMARVGDVARLQPGFAFKSEWYQKTGVRLLRGVNVSPGATRWEDVAYLDAERAAEYPAYSLVEGDIIIAMDRPLVSAGLKVCQIKRPDLPALLLQRVGRLLPEPGILPDYLYLFLLSGDFLRHCERQATGTQLPHISGNDIESARLPVPPTDEQALIVERVRSLFDRYSSVGKAGVVLHDRFPELERSILAKAFRGELVPQGSCDETASALLARTVEGAPTLSVKHERKSRESAPSASSMPAQLKAATAWPKHSPVTTSAAMVVPERPAARVSTAAASPVQQSQGFAPPADFLDLPAEAQTAHVHRILLGDGTLEREDAVRRAAELLRDAGQASFQRLRRNGTLATCIDAALSVGLRQGHFDRPRTGTVRAVAAEAAHVPPVLWRRALLASLVEPATDDDAAVRAAAAWSQAQFGLEFQRLRTGGHIDTALRAALAELLAAGELTRERNGALTLRTRPD